MFSTILKLRGLDDMEILVGILVRSGYTVHVKQVIKEYPRDNTINYFEVKVDIADDGSLILDNKIH